MRLTLIGDSHLARLTGRHRRLLELGLPAWDIDNRAVGGATVRDLEAQVAGQRFAGSDAAVLSIGTNDAADPPVPLDEFRDRVIRVRRRLPARVLVLEPPSIVEGPLSRGRTNDRIALYRAVLRTTTAAPHTSVLGVQDLADHVTGGGLVADGLHLDGSTYSRLVTKIVRELVPWEAQLSE